MGTALGWLAELYERAGNAVAARKHGIRNFWIVVVLGGVRSLLAPGPESERPAVLSGAILFVLAANVFYTTAAAPAWYAWLLMATAPH